MTKLWNIKLPQTITEPITDVIRKALCHDLLDGGRIYLINNITCSFYAVPYAPSALSLLHSQVRTKLLKP